MQLYRNIKYVINMRFHLNMQNKQLTIGSTNHEMSTSLIKRSIVEEYAFA